MRRVIVRNQNQSVWLDDSITLNAIIILFNCMTEIYLTSVIINI